MSDDGTEGQSYEKILKGVKAFLRTQPFVRSSDIEEFASEALARWFASPREVREAVAPEKRLGRICGIARNVAREWCRGEFRDRQRKSELLAKAKDFIAMLGGNDLESLGNVQSTAIVGQAIDVLCEGPRKYRAYLILHFLGWSYADIAHCFGITVGGFGSMLKQAKAWLRSELSKQQPAAGATDEVP
jgi:DNA-directed RNA polymerase specialized sigma24 family protein